MYNNCSTRRRENPFLLLNNKMDTKGESVGWGIGGECFRNLGPQSRFLVHIKCKLTSLLVEIMHFLRAKDFLSPISVSSIDIGVHAGS